jgi:sec-independent protein translocase protein TatC
MTTSAPPTDPPTETKDGYNPDEYRMTMGEHLDELRHRLIIVKVSLVCAAVLAGPWILYQIWQFVAAGLYPHERQYITKYIPLSIGLLIAGFVFVYFIVLPWTINFFLIFGDSLSLPRDAPSHLATTQPTINLPIAPLLDGDPPHPAAGQFWFNTADGRLKFFLKDGDVRVIPFGPSNLLAPHISLPEYVDLVLSTLLTFGLCFQLPLVVLTLTKIGIVNVAQLRAFRRYVYFALAIVAASMTPGDVVTAMLALMAPLVALYELGILLAAWGDGKAKETA